jgi:chloramphenicol 3-O-phosphotransferase
MEKGNIILLNGTSSLGKRAIVHPLQAIQDEPYLSLCVDNFLHNLPDRYMSDEGEDI